MFLGDLMDPEEVKEPIEVILEERGDPEKVSEIAYTKEGDLVYVLYDKDKANTTEGTISPLNN